MRLPALTRDALPRGRKALVDALAQAQLEQGYVHGRTADRDMFLFVRDGRVWCAGARDGGGPAAISPSAFVAAADAFEEVALCKTDLALFLCVAVLFRKPPAAHVPAALVDADALLKSLRALGKDSVLALQKNDAWALAFCRSGDPVALYEAPELASAPPPPPSSPHASPVQDRLLELIYTSPDQVQIDLYDEIKLPPSSDAGQLLAAMQAPLPMDAPRPTLVVLLGDRVVFRHRVDREETLVGRGEEAHLALDNLSVSRRHALVRVVGEKVVVEDLGSENGITLYDQRVPRAELLPGDRVGVGKYTLVYATHVVGADAMTPRPRAKSATSDIETVNLARNVAFLEHAGKRHKIASAIFTIGSSPDAHLRIRGLLVGDVCAVLQIDGAGYRVEKAGGARALRVNGESVQQKKLADGDEIVIAGQSMRFRTG